MKQTTTGGNEMHTITDTIHESIMDELTRQMADSGYYLKSFRLVSSGRYEVTYAK